MLTKVYNRHSSRLRMPIHCRFTVSCLPAVNPFDKQANWPLFNLPAPNSTAHQSLGPRGPPALASGACILVSTPRSGVQPISLKKQVEPVKPDASLVFDKASLPTYPLVAPTQTLALLNCVRESDILRVLL